MERTIRITGKGKIELKPDLTVIELNFSGIEKEYADALAKAADDVNELKEMLISLGFNKNDLKTTYFNVNSENKSYQDDKGNHRSKLVGFRYNQTLKFSMDIDNKILGKVLYALGRIKTHPKLNIMYTIKNLEEGKNLLLKEAIKDAKNKAKVIAEATNVKLGDILNIDYSFANDEFSYPLIECGCEMLYSKSNCTDSYDIDIEPDNIKVSDIITLIYAIE